MVAIGWSAVLVVLVLAYKYGHPVYKAVGDGLHSQSLVQKQALASLPTKSASSADLSHLGANILPPTNSWLSGMVLQKTPLAVYPLPLSFLAKGNGFEIGLPSITTTAQAISGGHKADIKADIGGATSFTLDRYDKISATLRYTDAKSQSIADVTLAEGSPFVFVTAKATSTVLVGGVDKASVSKLQQHYARYTHAGHDFVVVALNGASIIWNGSALEISAQKGSLVTFYSLPSSKTPDVLQPYAGNPLKSVSTSYAESGRSYTTTLKYKTANGKPTVFVPVPYQRTSGQSSVDLQYDSIYGRMLVYKGDSFDISSPTVTPSDKLNLSTLSIAQKAQLEKTLIADVAGTIIDKKDSYYAGKQLARAANLLSIAEQLGNKDAAAQLKVKLMDGFNARLRGDYFYYDTGLKGIAAQTNAFGSEDFNDHNFHYGYFLYAASILGTYDSSFVDTHKAQVDLLAADYANYQANQSFPLQRNYDAYAGRSWAAGLAPFSDGNNLESSSEAINAWNGVALWGKLTNNQDLEQSGRWMLANESVAARAAWRDVKMSGYTSPVVDINFGGKRVYSTFFTDDPTTKLGIQLIPLSPSMVNFASDPSINNRVALSVQNDNYNVSLGDYVLMYLALSDPAKAQSLVAKQQDAFIDDGNSRTYLQAWIYSVRK